MTAFYAALGLAIDSLSHHAHHKSGNNPRPSSYQTTTATTTSGNGTTPTPTPTTIPPTTTADQTDWGTGRPVGR
jgi:hypothetical protein